MKSTAIRDVHARQLLDCKCRPVVEVDVVTDGGITGRGSAPTGTSVGMHEAYVLRDREPSCFNGLSVHKAVENVNKIIRPALLGMNVMDQRSIDERMIDMDGTPNKANLGGNAVYSVSAACARAAAKSLNMDYYKYLSKGKIETLPIPTYNLVNGGYYKDIVLSFQEFTLVPYRASSMEEAVEIGVRTFDKVGELITGYQKGEPAAIGNYYGWAPISDDPEIILDLIHEAVCECGYENKVGYALDCASGEMYDEETKTYLYKGKRVTGEDIIGIVKHLSEKYNLLYVEDILEENDWDGFKKAVREISRTIIIGDDFTATNIKRLKKAYEQKAAEGFVFKPNQVGTITESIDAYNFAKEHGMIAVPSGRAGGVVGDIFIELAIGLQAPAVKNGAPRTGERIDLLNSLYRAYDENPKAKLYDFSEHIRF